MLAIGCGGSDEATSASSSTATTTTSVTAAPAPVGGLVATIGTNRLYALERAFGLRLQNVGDTPIVVRQLQLESPLFETVPLSTEEDVLPPRHRGYVLPIPYGEAHCEGSPEATFGAVIVLDDGEELRLQAGEDDPGAIARLHARECAAAEVRELADLRWGDQWDRDGEDAVRGELVLEQRREGTTIAVDDAVGSVIFTVRVATDGSPILRVDDDEPTATVPVVISVDRCDPHAMLESKRTFKFLAWVVVDDGESVPVEIEPTGAARAALEDLLATCLG